MTKEQFKLAESIREQINNFEAKKNKIRSIKERDNDEEFNTLRLMAYDGCSFAIDTLEQEFKSI